MRECLEVSQDESEAVSRVVVPSQRPGESSIYDMFCLRGIRVDRAEPGLVVCTLKVPPRLTVSLLALLLFSLVSLSFLNLILANLGFWVFLI